jgi:hypothetical protein
MLGMGHLVGLRLLTPPVGTDDGGLREEVIGVDVVHVGMGIDQETDRLVRNSTDFRQQALGHRGIGQAIDHDHIPVANDDPGAAVTDQGRLQEGVNLFRKFPELRHISPPFPRSVYGCPTQ